MGLPPRVPWLTSGYYVLEWLPQIATFLTSVILTLFLPANYDNALLWSKRVKQLKLRLSIDGAECWRIKQFVFAGLATTTTLTSFFATVFRASPCSMKIFPFNSNNSFLSIPAFLGKPPMNIPTSISLNKILGSEPD